jgi:hypothetical protein
MATRLPLTDGAGVSMNGTTHHTTVAPALMKFTI